MTGRILGMSGYLLKSLLFSLAGLLYLLMTLAFYIVFFDPRQQTPDADYFVLVLYLNHRLNFILLNPLLYMERDSMFILQIQIII